MSNNDFMLRLARNLAERVGREATGEPARIQRAYALCFQRLPDPEEMRAASGLVAEQGMFALCRLLLNANEFICLD